MFPSSIADRRSVFQQQIDDFNIAVIARFVQRSPTTIVAYVNFMFLSQKKINDWVVLSIHF